MKVEQLQSEINKLSEEIRKLESTQSKTRVTFNRIKLLCGNFLRSNKLNPIVKDLTDIEKKNIAAANKFATDIMRLINFK